MRSWGRSETSSLVILKIYKLKQHNLTGNNKILLEFQWVRSRKKKEKDLMIKSKLFQRNQVLGKKIQSRKVSLDRAASTQNLITVLKLKLLTRHFKLIKCRLNLVKFVIQIEKKKIMTLTWARENLSKPKGTLMLNPTSTGTEIFYKPIRISLKKIN